MQRLRAARRGPDFVSELLEDLRQEQVVSGIVNDWSRSSSSPRVRPFHRIPELRPFAIEP